MSSTTTGTGSAGTALRRLATGVWACVTLAGTAAAGVPMGFPQFPSISPDGSTIVVSWDGDLWAVPGTGGEAIAERLTAHPASETRSAFSPDGSMLAFESERDGARNIYVAPVVRLGGGRMALGEVRRATMSDRPQTLTAFSNDGKEVWFTGQHEPSIFRASRMYAAPLPVGADEHVGPVRRLTEAFGAGARPLPDGSGMVFHRTRLDATRPVYQGSGAPDVFALDLASGSFTQLTAAARPDAEAFVARDGSLVWLSSRSGQFNLYRISRAGAGWAADSAAVALTSFAPQGGDPDAGSIGHGVRDFSLAAGGSVGVFCVWDTLYTIDVLAERPEPRAVSLVAGGDAVDAARIRVTPGRSVSQAALSPDGKTLATIARGEVFVRSIEKDRPTRRVTASLAPDGASAGSVRARDIAWSPDGAVLFITADSPTSAGAVWIYEARVAATRDDLREPKEEVGEPKAEPSAETKPESKAEDRPEGDGERAGEKPAEGDAAKPEGGRRGRVDPGAKWADAVTFGLTALVTGDVDHRDVQPSPDGKWLLATRGLGDLVLIDVAKQRAGGEGASRVVAKGWSDPEASWASDSRHIVYAATDANYNSDIFLMDAVAAAEGGATPVNLTRHPDEDTEPRLSADGKVLYFLSDRSSDSNGAMEVFAISLDRKLDGLRAYELADYFKEASEAARKRKPLATRVSGKEEKPDAEPKADAAPDSKPDAKPDPNPDPKPDAKPESKNATKPKALVYDATDLATAYERVRQIPNLPERISALAITPAGDRIVVSATSDGTPSLASYDYLGKDRKIVFPGGGADVSVSLTGERVVFVSSGRAEPPGTTPSEDRPRTASGEAYLGRAGGGEAEKLPIEGQMTVDVPAQQRQKFIDASRLMGQRFYHPTMKGRDWAKLSARYLSLAERTRGNDEFNRVFNLLLGELDASHMGMSGGGEPAGGGAAASTSLGSLALDVKPVAGGYQVRRVVAGGPGDRPTSRLRVGDVIHAINGRTFSPEPTAMPTLDFLAALANTGGVETLVELTPAGGGARRTMLITPIGSGSETGLRYRAEVERNAARVAELSKGRLGYLHIRGMDLASARDFERDLFAAADGKDGLVIDVRDNGGGFTADILLASLTAPRHARTFAKGMDMASLPQDAYPRDRRLIYGYSRPITVLINQNSFSNAEIFAHAIKTIGRGRLVGVATYGGVISTGSASLIDGTTMRTPFRGWLLPGDVDMENNGAEPHLMVPQTPADEAADRDRQLEAAVNDLLAQVERQQRR